MQVKKQISLFLAFFLLISNVGLAFNVHYCEDKIASVTLNLGSNAHEIEKDCCGVVEKQSKCCHNKIIKSNDKSDQVLVKSFSYTPGYFFVNNDWKPFVFTSKINTKKAGIFSYYCDANAPPLYLLYSQYTFYA